MISFSMNDMWQIDRVLEGTEKEILFITAEAAGVKVYSLTRQMKDVEEYPYTSWINNMFVASRTLKTQKYVPHFKYEEVLAALRSMVAQQVKTQDNECK